MTKSASDVSRCFSVLLRRYMLQPVPYPLLGAEIVAELRVDRMSLFTLRGTKFRGMATNHKSWCSCHWTNCYAEGPAHPAPAYGEHTDQSAHGWQNGLLSRSSQVHSIPVKPERMRHRTAAGVLYHHFELGIHSASQFSSVTTSSAGTPLPPRHHGLPERPWAIGRNISHDLQGDVVDAHNNRSLHSPREQHQAKPDQEEWIL